MAAVLQLPTSYDPPPAVMDPDTRMLLNRIRFAATACRASARLDLFEACALLDPKRDHAEDAYITTLIRVMGQALDVRPVFRQPGDAELSFDEAWLVATLTACITGDTDSFVFLVERRVVKSRRRAFAMLVSGLAELITLEENQLKRETPAPAPSQTRLTR